MVTYLNIALIIISVLLILSVILQSKGAGLGGLTGADTGSIFTARRGVERTLFWVTIVLSVVFFAIVITLLIIAANNGSHLKGRSIRAARLTRGDGRRAFLFAYETITLADIGCSGHIGIVAVCYLASNRLLQRTDPSTARAGWCLHGRIGRFAGTPQSIAGLEQLRRSRCRSLALQRAYQI